jgi:hypothetical protein
MAISLIWTTTIHCLSQAHQEQVREHEAAVKELKDEAGEEAEEQNAAGVEKKRQVEEECLGVEARPGGRGRSRSRVVIILSQKSIRIKVWSIMNSSYRHV